MKTLTVAALQINAGKDLEQNFTRLNELLSDMPSADLVVLPEVFLLRGNADDYKRSAESIPGTTTERLSRIAAERHSWLLAGSIMEQDEGKVYNTCLLFNRKGEIAARYRKIHLFEAHLDDDKVIRESDSYTAGSEPVTVDIEGWCSGLAICYDLRFPELFRHYSDKGAHIFFVPSDFTQSTGKHHWETLLRARAIENQCFVVAPNQCGINEQTGIESYGNTMIIGPWGEVLGRAAEKEKILIAELDPALLETTRKRVPALDHRKL